MWLNFKANLCYTNNMTENFKELSHEDLDRLLNKSIIKARTNFYTFVKLMAPEVLPDDFMDGRHIEVICDALQSVEESVANPKKTPKRLQLFLPPGSMKSKLASNLFPTWCLGRHPNWCFLAIGSDYSFAVDNFGRPTRDIVELPQYQAIFPEVGLRKDVAGADRWDTTKRGRFVARGAGQNIAGRRAMIAICDDVITEQTTKNGRQEINKWYQKGLRTRLLPRGAEVIINTRWYLDDLSGFTEKLDAKSDRPWEIIKIPALLDEKARKLLRRKGDPEELYAVGTSFWPELWPTESFLEKKEVFPPSEWNALYMQNPIPEEGNIIKRESFQYWESETPPKCKYVVISLDTAFSSKETADYSAYTVWGVFDQIREGFDGERYKIPCAVLLGCEKNRWEFPDLCQKVQELYDQFEADFVLIENKASGQSLIQEMRRRGLPVVEYSPERDKITRLHSASPFFTSQRVFVPKDRQYAEELIADVCGFPNIPHDDMVDTVSQAILWLRDSSYIENNGYPERESEVERMWKNKQRKTYWSSLGS